MVKSGKAIQVLYSKMVHGLHHDAEEVSPNFNTVDQLISSVKKILLKTIVLYFYAYTGKFFVFCLC